MQILENLLETLSEASRRHTRVRAQIAQVVVIAAAADVLQVGTGTEDAVGAGQHDHTHVGVSRQRQAGAAQVLRSPDVERVEARWSIDRDESHGVLDPRADVFGRDWHQQILGSG